MHLPNINTPTSPHGFDIPNGISYGTKLERNSFQVKQRICELNIRKHENNEGEGYQDLSEINSNILTSVDYCIIPQKISPTKDPERIRTTTLIGIITLKDDKHKYKKEEGYPKSLGIKSHSEIFSSIIPGNSNKISKIITNIDTLSDLGNKIKLTSQIVDIQLLYKNNKYNIINLLNRTSINDNKIPFFIDSIHPSSTLKYRYPKSSRI